MISSDYYLAKLSIRLSQMEVVVAVVEQKMETRIMKLEEEVVVVVVPKTSIQITKLVVVVVEGRWSE